MIADLSITSNTFNQLAYFTNPIDQLVGEFELFDQNGYNLTQIEILYAMAHSFDVYFHRPNGIAIKQQWIIQQPRNCFAVLNHCNLFERKGFANGARQQLEYAAKENPLLWKIIRIKPKWGLDFSIDYCDRQGNVFEILHWEWDSFDFDEINYKKQQYESKLVSIDWDDAGKQLLAKKDQWYNLDFYQQSEWKCNFFGIEKERFKMVCWE